MNRCKHILLVLLISVFGVSCGKETLHIHGNLDELEDETVYLRVYEGSLRTIDSTQSVNGRFQFDMPEILPDMVYLQFSDSDYYIPILVDGGEVFVSGNYLYPNEIQVSGTPANDTFWKYRQHIYKNDIIIEAIDIDIKRLSEENADSLKISRLIQRRKQLQSKHDNYRTEFVRANRGSLVSAFLVESTVTTTTTHDQIDSLINELEPSMADNAFMRRLHRQKKESAK